MDKEQLLRNPDVYPSDEVIAGALAGGYKAYTGFMERLPDLGIELQWKYYNDGKSWLCKGAYKQKTVFWLSVWDGFFRVSFFFNEKNHMGAHDLPISDDIKTKFANEKHVGKLMPLLIDVDCEALLDDVFAIMRYKKSLK